jgi:putative tryptophan/tyrosine transport system substrate-binding protein
MRRREFIVGLGATTAWPTANAQESANVRRLGVLMGVAATSTEYQTYLNAFIQELRQLGWIEGQNLKLDIRWSEGNPVLARLYAGQLIELMPNVILTASTLNLATLQQATNTVPIVFTNVADPVAQGFVASLSRPGGNITGFFGYQFSIAGKWVALLKEAMPDLSRVGVIFNRGYPPIKNYMEAIEAASVSLGVEAITLPIQATADLKHALENVAAQPASGLILPADPFLTQHYGLIALLAVRYRLPASGPVGFAREGGLIGYGYDVSTIGQYVQAAGYVDRILKGAKPADLPVQAATKYRLVINLKAGLALGLTIPETLLATADEVIE